MNNCTLAPPDNTQTVLLIVTTVGTLVISTLDLFINTYVAVKKRHLHSECCGSVLDYTSEAEEKK